MLLKEIPDYEKPREKAKELGIERLSNVELLAILIRTGTKGKNVLETSKEILYKLENIKDLNTITLTELTSVKGIGNDKAITVLAAIEFGKRINEFKKSTISFAKAEDVFEYFKIKMNGLEQENLYVIYLNNKLNLLDIKLITTGTINTTLFDATTILKWALKFSSPAIILVHNHPSGDPTPSVADYKMTDLIIKQCELLNITVIDHIIIGETFHSMKRSNEYKKFKH